MWPFTESHSAHVTHTLTERRSDTECVGAWPEISQHALEQRNTADSQVAVNQNNRDMIHLTAAVTHVAE